MKSWEMVMGDGPIVATAIHNGHALRDEAGRLIALDEAVRLMEEDPYTERLAGIVENRIIVYQSRFEYDLNRPPEGAVYLRPEDAWGLNVWKDRPSEDFISRSRSEYDRFYRDLKMYFQRVEKNFRHFIVLDIHSYNHRRVGPDGPPADPEQNPEVNVGTGTLDRKRWSAVVERFMKELREFEFMRRHLDARENVKFKGGYFSRWIHENFPRSACVLALEFKKYFMDEWTGKVYERHLDELKKALTSTLPGLAEELRKFS